MFASILNKGVLIGKSDGWDDTQWTWAGNAAKGNEKIAIDFAVFGIICNPLDTRCLKVFFMHIIG